MKLCITVHGLRRRELILKLDEDGRDHLDARLSSLADVGDHFHLFSEAWGGWQLTPAADPEGPAVHQLDVSLVDPGSVRTPWPAADGEPVRGAGLRAAFNADTGVSLSFDAEGLARFRDQLRALSKVDDTRRIDTLTPGDDVVALELHLAGGA